MSVSEAADLMCWKDALVRLRNNDSYHYLYNMPDETPDLEGWQWAWEFCRRDQKYVALSKRFFDLKKDLGRNAVYENDELQELLSDFGLTQHVGHKIPALRSGTVRRDIWSKPRYTSDIPTSYPLPMTIPKKEIESIDNLAAIQWELYSYIRDEFTDNYEVWRTWCRQKYACESIASKTYGSYEDKIKEQRYADIRLYSNSQFSKTQQLNKCDKLIDLLSEREKEDTQKTKQGASKDISRLHKMLLAADLLTVGASKADVCRLLSISKDTLRDLLKSRERTRKNGGIESNKGIDYYIEKHGYLELINENFK